LYPPNQPYEKKSDVRQLSYHKSIGYAYKSQ
jgi:hypothetical protein